MNIKKHFFLLLSLFAGSVVAMELGPSITKYQSERDWPAIEQILHENYDFLTYESRGYPEGTTKKYIESPKNYITDVLRVNDQTVGFVNYCSVDSSFLTFHISRQGLIHLMGVDKEFQRKGYGSLLLQHAVVELEKRNMPKIVLGVRRENTAAQKLYSKAGFTCMFSAQLQEKMPDWIYERQLDIPKDKLPQGNIIQRYPKTFLCAIVALALWYRLM